MITSSPVIGTTPPTQVVVLDQLLPSTAMVFPFINRFAAKAEVDAPSSTRTTVQNRPKERRTRRNMGFLPEYGTILDAGRSPALSRRSGAESPILSLRI